MKKKPLPYHLEDVLDNVYNYVSIVDGNGKVVFVNDAIRRYGRMKNEILGKTIRQLLDEGYMQQSVVEKCIETGKPQAMVQRDSDGDYLNWASGFYDENGDLQYVVCTEWDLKHLNNLQDLLVFKNTLTVDENQELDYYRSKNVRGTELIYRSSAMQRVINFADQAAGTDITVLLQGESGTGKEVLMKYMHYKSAKAGGPLIAVNCSAIPEHLIESELFGYEKGAFTGADAKGKRGVFELANNGTLFLDEIGDMPVQTQGKLLRALQEKKIMRVGGTSPVAVNPRIIAATNIDLARAVEEKQFRLDLYYRLNIMPITLPPLRERKEDIAAFAEHFVMQNNRKYKRKIRFAPMAVALMETYTWPGNVRELENLIERLYIQFPGNEITERLLAGFLPGNEKTEQYKKGAVDLKDAVEALERNMLASKIGEYENLRQFAGLFGIEKTTMHRKLKKYGIIVKDIDK